MAIKEHQLLPLFKQFIKDTAKGKRTKSNGEKILPQSIANYQNCLNLLIEFSLVSKFNLRIREYNRLGKRERASEAIYWKRFNQHFIAYLLNQRQVYDNYSGSLLKLLKAVFEWINHEKLIDTGPYYKSLKIIKQEVPVTALTREHLMQLIYNSDFENNLPANLRISKDMFVFGCTVALRYSDLSKLTTKNFEKVGDDWYMKTISKKTKAYVSVKLPLYAVEILIRYKSKSKKLLFRQITLLNFNKHIKLLGERMGLTHSISKLRSRRGIMHELVTKKNELRFCDTMSSHMMRRTAITNMLTLGMSEIMVKHISGHAGDSKSFHRYINYSRAFMNEELDKVYAKMI